MHSFIISISDKLFYTGCYNFKHENEHRKNPDFELTNVFDDHQQMTIGKCMRHCRGFGKSFVGLDKWACYCTNKWPLEPKKLLDSDCNAKCTGELGARWNCGGGWKLSVYSIQ